VQVLEQIEPQVAGRFALLQRLFEPWKDCKSYVNVVIAFTGMLSLYQGNEQIFVLLRGKDFFESKVNEERSESCRSNGHKGSGAT